MEHRTADRANQEPGTPSSAPSVTASTRGADGASPLETAIDTAVASIREDLNAVEDELGRLLHSTLAIIPKVGGHLAFAGGKRFRPIVSLLGAHAVGVDLRLAIPVAAVGELLHTATLLHDDVIDGADYRRGRPAARYQYGNGVAVLTGDYCLARALQAMADTQQLVAVRTMADTVTRMAEGEVAQLQVAGDWAMDRERYYMVIDRKTAALIAWCTSVAGLVPSEHCQALHSYGLEIGYAFQISDDVIDYSGDLDSMGKAKGQDLREGKMTIPLLFACDREPSLRPRLSELLKAGPPFPEEELLSIVGEVQACGALDAARDLANEHSARACEYLTALPDTPYKSALEAIALHIAGRST